ncbi:MAG: SDR family oxidoreductase [Bacteroidetes bacterium]|uniref:SDR family oxidoreductase n=1 Tax=Candidatus Cryptobacteroides intestinavium TaxID=2840766 RepID=A0A9D9ES13_9BACT|nr:SDR family oxidoreductase [Candidatus Cryptobacteroides intestinavium]
MKKDFFRGKVIVITGASSGIGLASARLFASLGARLSLAARSIDRLEAEAASLTSSGDILCVRTDVSREEDCRNLIEKTVERFGRIDILVNNAGVSMRAMFRDLDLGVIKTLMDVNFWGTVYCTKYALPYLLESKGSVVGVISIAGYAGLPGRTGYSSSKYAIRGFLDTLRIEHLYDGLHVMVFAPGFTASNVRNAALTADGSRQGKTPRDEGKMMTAEKVAEYMARGLERRKSEMILTPIGKLTVFMHNILPRLTDRLEFSYMAKEPDSPFHK